MSWFEKAKTVLIEALDIQDDDDDDKKGGSGSGGAHSTNSPKSDEAEKRSISTASQSSSLTGAFFDNPNANEMVTIPPRCASDVIAGGPSTPIATNKLIVKRQSATSDSVDLLSSPTSPLDDEDVPINNSESSLELITGTTASEIATSPDTEPLLPDSIVIIASNDTSNIADDEDDDVDDQHIVTGEQSMHLNDSTKTIKAMTLNETHGSTGGGGDSDSTQSFEDIQMQISNKFKITADSQVKGELVDQSYSSTSSDIEIISNLNGDSNSSNSNTTRISPLKLKEIVIPKQKDSGNVIVGQLKPKGHYRELSEISLLSEDSQSELDKLIHRISELNQVIETREQRLLQSEHQNAQLIERNQELQAALDAAYNGDVNTDANEAVQRLSALEKKFQGSIRERDALRIQIKALKDELQNKIPKDELTESNEMIAALQLEGEKLSKEILQQSNIIKKLRAKEKTTDMLLKKNGEQISQLSSETERLKKSLAAKDEVERTQIEAVHKMTTEKRKVDEKNAELRSQIEDLESKLHALQSSFDGIKNDLHNRTRQEEDKYKIESQQLIDMRKKMRTLEHGMAKREQQLREENRELLRRLEEAELRTESSTTEMSQSTALLTRQIESLQRTLNQRMSTWNKEEQLLLQKLEKAQKELSSLQNVESSHNEKYELMRTRCNQLEEQLSSALLQTENAKILHQQMELEKTAKDAEYEKQIADLNGQLAEYKEKVIDFDFQKSKWKLLEESHQQAGVEPLASELTVEAVSAANDQQNKADLQQKQEQLLHGRQSVHSNGQQAPASPPLSLANDSGSNDEALCGIVDWHTDDLECLSNSGRQTSGIIQGVHLNFLSQNTTTLEHLQSLLKQKDGELTHIQWELARLQTHLTVLNNEIATLTEELVHRKEQVEKYELMEKNYEDLQHKYDAVLQMFGEKVERTEELELDLAELKAAYKLQIDELLAQAPQQQQQQNKTNYTKRGGT